MKQAFYFSIIIIVATLLSLAKSANAQTFDVEISQVISPKTITVSFHKLTIEVINHGPDTVTNLNFFYSLNNVIPATNSWSGVLPPSGIKDTLVLFFTYVNPFLGYNNACIWSYHQNDTDNSNDTACSNIYYMPYVSSAYLNCNDFEQGQSWIDLDTIPIWQYGQPSGNLIDSAFSGNNAYVTNLNGAYNTNDTAYLYTTYYDFSSYNFTDTAILSFWHYRDMDAGHDFGIIEYSNDLDHTWNTLGVVNDPNGVNWYDTTINGQDCFSNNDTGWVKSEIRLDPMHFNMPTPIQFRFLFVSDSVATANEGWAIDDFCLQRAPYPFDVGIDSLLYPVNDTMKGSDCLVKIRARNYGTQPVYNVPVRVYIYLSKFSHWVCAWDNISYIPPFSSVDFTFSTPYTVPNEPYKIIVYTDYLGDMYLNNDSVYFNSVPLPGYNDVGISRILAPNVNVPLTYPQPVIAMIKNYGLNTQNSVPVSYYTPPTGNISDVWYGSLGPGDSALVIFSQQFSPPYGYFELCVESHLSGDIEATNDESCVSVYGHIFINDTENNSLTLSQNIPNPANITTTINYSLKQAEKVTFIVLDALGREMYQQTKNQTAGDHHIDLDISNYPPGIYFYYIEVKGIRSIKKMIVL